MKNFKNNKLFIINSIKTESRHNTILPTYVGKTVQIHNGKNYTKIMIIREMIGHKFGEFVKTRKTFKFKKK